MCSNPIVAEPTNLTLEFLSNFSFTLVIDLTMSMSALPRVLLVIILPFISFTLPNEKKLVQLIKYFHQLKYLTLKFLFVTV